MSRYRLSPLTIKKDFIQSSKRQTQTSIDEQVQSIQYRLKNIHFSQSQQIQIKQLWEIYMQTKQAENNIKILNENLQQFGGISSPSIDQKSSKNSKNNLFQPNHSARMINNLLNETQLLKNEINSQIQKSDESNKQSQTERLRQAIKNKEQLTQKISKFEKQLHTWLSEVKMMTTNSKVGYDSELNKKIRQSEAFIELEKKNNRYQDIIGMLMCIKKNMDDEEIGIKVKERYQRLVNLPGNKNKRSMKEILIDVEKRQILDQINLLLDQNDNEILNEANYLKNQIKQIESLYLTENIQVQCFSEKKFFLAFKRLQKLCCKIEGLNDKYEEELEKIQQLLTLSKPKLYSIQHKDTELAQSYAKFIEKKQRWEDLSRMLQFEYCNY